MNVGWHFVESSDTSAPLGAATYLDVGGSEVGVRSPEQMCRPYFKGAVPDMIDIIDGIKDLPSDVRIQLGNELNLELEEYPGTPADYKADYYAFKDICARRVYWAPPSPGIPGWQEWLEGAEEADGIVLHCYGTLAEMQAPVVYTVLRYPGKPIWIGECNFGPAAGKYVDLGEWTRDHFLPFLDWCDRDVPEVEAVTYFAYKWPNADSPQGTPVDGAGTAVEKALKEWRPRMPDDPRIQQLLAQNALITDALIAYLKGNVWDGAESVAGQVVALTGKTLGELGISPK